MRPSRNNDVEFGRVLEAIQNTDRRINEMRAEMIAHNTLVMSKVESIQADVNRAHGAKAVLSLIWITVSGFFGAIIEYVRVKHGS